ncbi:MAG TPA: hypothetical protein VHZ31_06080 [Solirubrobacteraceae bacterium]|jgi:hypothetical protein|nr:hypothetical protein [Solirubrobacteraceae bacterium]
MAESFDILRDDLEKRLDALPDGEGDRTQARTREQIEAEERAFAASLADRATLGPRRSSRGRRRSPPRLKHVSYILAFASGE